MQVNNESISHCSFVNLLFINSLSYFYNDNSRLADAHNFKNLMKSALTYIQNNFPQILKEDEIYELPKDLIVEFFSSEKLRVDSEFQVFQAALRWITHDINERRQYVFEILQHVRLPLLSLSMIYFFMYVHS